MTSDQIQTPYGEMKASFSSAPLSDLCDEKDGVQTGPFGTQLHKRDYVEIGTPIITVEHLGDNRITTQNLPMVSDDDVQRLSKYELQDGDIVFSRVGSVDRRALVRQEEDGWLFSGRCLRVRPNPEKINSKYLAWFFGHLGFQEHIRQIAVGATMPSINTKILSNVEIFYPPLPEQRAIASILGALDDKIELNRRMNTTLESLARAIFKSWFVDFDPVKINAGQMPAGSIDPKVLELFPSTFQESELGPIPEGWTVKPLSDICKLLSGGTPKKKVEEYWNGNLPWISPKAMNGIHVFESDNCVTEAAVGNGTRLVPEGTTLVMVRGMGLHQGVRISQAQRDVTFNQDVKALIPTTVDSTFLLHAILDAATGLFGKVRAAGHGTGVLSTDIIKSLQFVIPPDDVLDELTTPLTELNQRFHTNELKSQILADLRDSLLPQLLSGSWPVPYAACKTVGTIA